MKDTLHEAEAAAAAAGTATLIGEALSMGSRLIHSEIDLARAEFARGVRDAIRGATLVIAGAMLVVTALNVLAGLIAAHLMERGWSPLQTGLAEAGGLVLVALLLVWRGFAMLEARGLFPRKAMTGIRKDAQTLKELL